MSRRGPAIEALTRRLLECPPEFLLEPRVGKRGIVEVSAVVADLLCALQGGSIPDADVEAFEGLARNHARLVLVASWLLHDPFFRQEAPRFCAQAHALLAEGLAPLARLVDAELFVRDPDRREELARLALRALELLPEGESEAQAEDRFAALDSVERARVIAAVREQEKRLREVREAMAKQAAEEAAAKVARE